MEKKSVKISLTTIICIVIIIILLLSIGIYLIVNKLSKVKDDGVNIINADKIINIIDNEKEEEKVQNNKIYKTNEWIDLSPSIEEINFYGNGYINSLQVKINSVQRNQNEYVKEYITEHVNITDVGKQKLEESMTTMEYLIVEIEYKGEGSPPSFEPFAIVKGYDMENKEHTDSWSIGDKIISSEDNVRKFIVSVNANSDFRLGILVDDDYDNIYYVDI